MKLPLLFLMIFSVTNIVAQLYIAPSDKSESYIYLKNTVLYVDDNLELLRNNKKDIEASIYLRKGSQLIQGEKEVTGNRGTGMISVFQKGTSNAYDYNYWSLPVITNDGLLIDYIFEPLTETNSRNAKLISALDGHSDPLSISNRWIYTFSGSNYSNWHYAGDHFDLLPGEGFSMKGVNGVNLSEIEEEIINKGNAQNYDFRGIPNDGLIKLPIKTDQVLLVGNPYPSAMDLDKFLMENTSTTGIAYFWDSRENGNSHYLLDYEGGYGTYSPGAGVYVPPIFKKYSDNSETGESGKYYERSVSPIAQGFMLRGASDGMIQFKNNYRLFPNEDSKQAIFKSVENEKSSLNLNIEIDSAYIQKLALVFKADSSIEAEHAMDAKKMNEDFQDISWNLSNEAFVINVRPRLDQELIPLKISVDKDSKLKFYISEMSNFNPDRVFLVDAQDDLYFSIQTGYLKLDLAKGEYKDRFFLSFIEKVELEAIKPDPGQPNNFIEKPKNILLNTVDIFQNNLYQQLEIKMLYDAEINIVRLYDLNGKLLAIHNLKSKEKEFKIPTGNLSNTVYIVKVNTSDNKELTKKINVRN